MDASNARMELLLNSEVRGRPEIPLDVAAVLREAKPSRFDATCGELPKELAWEDGGWSRRFEEDLRRDDVEWRISVEHEQQQLRKQQVARRRGELRAKLRERRRKSFAGSLARGELHAVMKVQNGCPRRHSRFIGSAHFNRPCETEQEDYEPPLSLHHPPRTPSPSSSSSSSSSSSGEEPTRPFLVPEAAFLTLSPPPCPPCSPPPAPRQRMSRRPSAWQSTATSSRWLSATGLRHMSLVPRPPRKPSKRCTVPTPAEASQQLSGSPSDLRRCALRSARGHRRAAEWGTPGCAALLRHLPSDVLHETWAARRAFQGADFNPYRTVGGAGSAASYYLLSMTRESPADVFAELDRFETRLPTQQRHSDSGSDP